MGVSKRPLGKILQGNIWPYARKRSFKFGPIGGNGPQETWHLKNPRNQKQQEPKKKQEDHDN